MDFLRKTKKLITFRHISWLIYIIAFAGLLTISLVLLTNNSKDLIIDPNKFVILMCVFTGLFGINFILQYLIFRKNDQAFSEFSRSLSRVEKEIGASLDYDIPENLDMTNITALLNHSLQSLNEKNQRLKSEIERNERLSENINEFYRQMRTLRDSDLIFDFFEYDVKSSVFVFISGMITALADDENEFTEITGQDLFKDYRFSISFDEFSSLVERSIYEDMDMIFECSVTGKENRIHWLKFWGRPSKDKTRITGTISDITSEVHMRDIEKERAIHDNITGFYNRNALAEVAGKAIAECAEGECVVFAYIGLTGYQEFQERFGMVAGNSYIRVCAEVFKKFITDRMIPIRWWGSDFLVIVRRVKSLKLFRREAIAIMNKLEKYIGEVDGIAVTFPMAIGYAASGIHGNNPAELLEYASFAEHEALRKLAESPNEFNRERFEDAHKAALRRTFIKDIIDRNQLSVVFQPIVSLRTGELFGFEALSRPLNPIYGNILELIDDAEASGHYVILEKRMVYNALDMFMERDQKYRDHYLFINTAPYATLDEKDYNDIRERYFGHMKVVFEVIERNRMEPDEINRRKSIVTKAGAKFALDDFGTGYSNHLALLALEPDIIKIDRELVRNIDDDLRKQHMLEDIISYARYRGTRVLVEGVETQGELETLCRMGVDYAQGFFIGKPVGKLSDPDPRAINIIKSISHKNRIDMRQVYIIIEKSLAFINEKLAENLSITTFLMIKLGKRLGMDNDKIIGLVITTIFHDVGVLYPGCEESIPGNKGGIPGHSIFSYLLFKEFSPYPEYSRIILYHHRKYSDDSASNTNGVLNNITIPDEAYLLSLAETVAEAITESDPDHVNEKVASIINENGFKPEYKEAFKFLCQDNILSRIKSGGYRDELLTYIKSINISKAETESLIRTFIYAVSFRSPFNFSHPRVMEATVNLLGRMTKQNWNLLEKVRAAALLYNLGMLTMEKETFEIEHSPKGLHELLHKSMDMVNEILEEAELMDIVAMFKGAIGEKAVNSRNSLMGKDIISGSNMINIADIFASLMEQRCSKYDTCMDALEKLKSMGKTEKLYYPMIELMEDYIEDIEARIKAIHSEITKQYQNVITGFEKLKHILITKIDKNQ